MKPPVNTSGTRSFLSYPPKIPVELVDAFHLEWALWNYLIPIGQTSISKNELKNWPAAMGITRKRFDNALAVLRDSYRISFAVVGKVTVIHLLPQYAPVLQSSHCQF
ncbi:hypothetical protein [Burkholderia pseudomultivorans]|uniref:hypothetical protein n=1 Tax=Burkholderia pseudomultivorans TaxID=1207504 RepID=UPI000B0B0086|nr:hypothetical protein [Burkholderia pseudomultivorans]